MKAIHSLAALCVLTTSAQAVFTAVGVYDENVVRPNVVDFTMPYSADAGTTTGIGQTLGALQVVDAATFKTNVEAAFTAGSGGVINFDNDTLPAGSTSFSATFGGGSKTLTLTNNATSNAGSTKFTGTDLGNRTPISGNQYLSTSGTPNFDFDLTHTGLAPGVHVTAIGITILGRNNSNPTSNWRVIAYYTNGSATGSTSTFRTLNTVTGNNTNDSFSGIVAPNGYWITRFRVQSESGAFSSLDDFGFITSDTTPIPIAPTIVTDLPALSEPLPGDTVNLSVALNPDVTPAPAYQWFKDNLPVPVGSGGTNAVYSFTAGPTQDGVYRVEVSNSQGGDVSANATVITFVDGDGDLLSNYSESNIHGTNPILPDTDGDTLTDYEEVVTYGTNPLLDADFDGDGLKDAFEVNTHFSNPKLVDTDGDTLSDLVETNTRTWLSSSSTGTSPSLADTDGDLLPDNVETKTGTVVSVTNTGTNPNLFDTDADGLDDRAEVVTYGTNPFLNADKDGDGLTDANEVIFHSTNPSLVDTDLDGISDFIEVNGGTDPNFPSNALGWFPGGVDGGTGNWNLTNQDWRDGHPVTPTAVTWTSGKIALFRGNLAANATVTLDINIPGVAGFTFANTGAGYYILTGSTLEMTGTPVMRMNKPVVGTIAGWIASTIQSTNGFEVHATKGETLVLNGTNAGFLSGTILVKPNAQIRAANGGASFGDAQLVIENGGVMRHFAEIAGAQVYTQSITLNGFGIPTETLAASAGAMRFRDINARTFNGPVLLGSNSGIKMDGGSIANFTTGVGLAVGVTAADFHIAQDAAATATLIGPLTLGTGAFHVGNLPISGGGGTGGVVSLSNASNIFGSVTIGSGTLRTDVSGAIPANLPLQMSGGILNLNGFPLTALTLNGTGGTVQTGANGAFVFGDGSAQTFNGLITTAGLGSVRLNAGSVSLGSVQSQFGAVLGDGSFTIGSGSTVTIAGVNGMHGYANGIMPWIIESGATVTTAPDITTHATVIRLRGGTLASGTPNTVFGSYDFQAGGTGMLVDGATTSTISASDMRLQVGGTGYQIQVLNGAAANDLLVTGIFNGTGTGGLRKTGAGLMRLAAGTVHAFTGPATVEAGTLALDGSLSSTTLIDVRSGATLDVSSHAGGYQVASAQTVTGNGSVTGGLVFQAGSTYRATGDATSNGLEISGLLNLTGAAIQITGIPVDPVQVIATYGSRIGTFTNPAGVPAGYSINYAYNGNSIALVQNSGNTYTTWIAGFGLTGPNAALNFDYDGDGFSNGVEFVLGTSPTARTAGPLLTVTGTNLIFEYTRNDDSEIFNPTVEFGSTLTGWTTAVNGVNATIATQENAAAPDTVIVTIPRGSNPGLFARLKLVVN